MGTTLYRKTAAGTAEIRARSGGLDARSRTLLILCNGSLSEAELSAHMQQPVGPLLVQLVGLGLLEAVSSSRAAAAVRGPGARAAAPEVDLSADRTPAFRLRSALATFSSGFGASRFDSTLAGLPTLTPEEPLSAEQHAAMVRRAWAALEPLFGPGTAERIEPLDRAVEPADVRRALDGIRDAVAIYRGKRAASELAREILNG